MIKLTSINEMPFYLNPNHIVSIFKNKEGGSNIYTTLEAVIDSEGERGEPYEVSESPEEVVNLINAYRQNV